MCGDLFVLFWLFLVASVWFLLGVGMSVGLLLVAVSVLLGFLVLVSCGFLFVLLLLVVICCFSFWCLLLICGAACFSI